MTIGGFLWHKMHAELTGDLVRIRICTQIIHDRHGRFVFRGWDCDCRMRKRRHDHWNGRARDEDWRQNGYLFLKYLANSHPPR